jgi:hypothetical protein
LPVFGRSRYVHIISRGIFMNRWNTAAGPVVALTIFLAGCTGGGDSSKSSGIQGTYADNAGSMLLELKAGNAANFTFMGDVESCTYAVNGMTLTVTCTGPAGATDFTIHDDGSLSGPPGSFIPILTKKK